MMEKPELNSSLAEENQKLLPTMKITKILVGSAALLLTAAVFQISQRNREQKLHLAQPRKFNSIPKLAQQKLDQDRALTVAQELVNYPYASARLEELYGMYPNLRKPPFNAPTEKTILEEIELRFAFSQFDFPIEILEQLLGEEEWDQDAVGVFLNSKEEVLDSLIQLSQLSPENPLHFHRIYDGTQVVKLLTASDLLGLSWQHSVRAKNWSQASALLEAQTRFIRSTNNGSFLQSIAGMTMISGQVHSFIVTANDGYDLSSSLPPSFSPPSPVVSAINGLRNEFANMVSMMEMFHHSENQEELELIFSVIGETEKPLTLAKVREIGIRSLEEDYAKVISTYVATFEEMEKAFQSGDWSKLEAFKEQLIIGKMNLSQESESFVKQFAPPIRNHPDKLINYSNNLQTIEILRALQQAKANDLDASSLKELVPKYLPEIPKHPITQEPIDEYALDSQTILKALE